MVDVTGAVQASFNGTGQYVGAQQGLHGTQTAEQQFTLAKGNGSGGSRTRRSTGC